MVEANRAPRADSIYTRERILDASEQLFGERGYSGASVRAIAESAEVNLAAINYHFGSKEKLLQATFERCMAPLNDERLRRLDALERGPAPELSEVVRALVEPGMIAASDPKVPQLLARLFAEPKSVSVPLLEHTFRPVAQRFIKTLTNLLPMIPASDLRWRFHLMVGAMVHLANFNQPLDLFDATSQTEATASTLANGIEQLVAFVVAGIGQDVSIGART